MSANTQTAASAQYGDVREIPLNRLKASPRNARRVGHPAEVIEARAASIQAKGVLQPLVVEPELKDGRATGYYLVSAGEGRRQALRLLAKRRVLAKAVPVRCVVDTVNDPVEVSLDENSSREPMHPADAYEAFRELSERRGWSAEEIAARFGLKPDTVRQRLRLGSVAPGLLDLYREGAVTLEQVTAFAVNPDVVRQQQVFDQLPEHQRYPHVIRRMMVEDKVAGDDRRVVYVGLDAYEAAGGPVLRDLFTPAGGGWAEDVALLERLVFDKLAVEAARVQAAEGWKWVEAYLSHPHGHGWSRVWERVLPRPADEVAMRQGLYGERDELIDRYPDLEDLPEEVEARLDLIDRELEALADDYGFDPAEKARAGAFLVLGQDGEVRIERGYVRPEDLPPEPEPDEEDEADEASSVASSEGAAPLVDNSGSDEPEEEPLGDAAAPLPVRILADLTAHRSAALRCVLAESPDIALAALVHVLALRTFSRGGAIPSCLDVRMGSHELANDGEGIEDSRAGLANAERHAAWARQMPENPVDFWAFVVGLDADSRLSLLAHCLSRSLDAVRGWENRPGVWLHGDQLATALDLDMRDWWSPSADRYLNAVTKAHVLAAVAEASKPEDAERMAKLKKGQMVEVAEPVLLAARWLPSVLRTAKPQAARADEGGEGDRVGPPVEVGATAPGDEEADAAASADEVEPQLEAPAEIET
ncbi:ParB/RepB/Spo0J family partition protein [Caulobacter segnis]|uniref:ParB/RepB/Spo0J family partition protein n=1 Tax=Caulobacter segnis TaxID=88688 RepID=UPI0026C22B56|nr:ParB/RepB/Spo0J family partition protein [Caulobacter segnis]